MSRRSAGSPRSTPASKRCTSSTRTAGFTVVGFPCNQFGAQEPGTAEEIETFCSTTYGVTFPMMEKIDVNGEIAAPDLRRARPRSPTPRDMSGDIRWNFEKFLIAPDGIDHPLLADGHTRRPDARQRHRIRLARLTRAIDTFAGPIRGWSRPSGVWVTRPPESAPDLTQSRPHATVQRRIDAQPVSDEATLGRPRLPRARLA